MLGVVLSPETRRVIDDHVRLLLAWNGAVNLTAIRDPAEIAVRHVAESLLALPVFRATGLESLVDLGSGGGYPGLPLAIALPARHALLVESVGKKARFLATVVNALGLAGRVEVAPERAETLARDPARRERWPAVTARAVASLAELVELAFPLLTRGGILVAWKAGGLDAELRSARRAIHGLGGGDLAIHPVPLPSLSGLRLVVATKRGRSPKTFPRDPAMRRQRPW